MNKKPYLSVSEYAAIKGISKQAVYKQLNNKLKGFLTEVDGKKYIVLSALTEEERRRVEMVEQPIKQPVEQPIDNPIQPLLERQIAEKDKTIESLLRQIENLQAQNSKLTDMNGQLAELLKNSQVLLAAEKQQQFIEQGKTAPETAPTTTETAPPITIIEQTETETAPTKHKKEKKKRKGLFGWRKNKE